jgi:DNA modification methylase
MEKNKRITWTIEKRKLSDLNPHPKNPREFTEKGMKDLENSINSIGFMQPININQDGTILSGHARAMKLQDIGEKEVDVYVPDRVLTPKQEEEVLIRANANTAGKWDWDLLANDFELDELDDWGLEVPDLELGEEEPEVEEDEVPEVKKDPFVKRGDIWELGSHRLMCGDSTMIDDVEKLMDGQKADMVFTDPPYNAGFNGREDKDGNKHDIIINDDLDPEVYHDFMQEFFNVLISLDVKESYVCLDWRAYLNVGQMFKHKQLIVCNKDIPCMGRGYRNKHEFIMYNGDFQSTEEVNVWSEVAIQSGASKDDSGTGWFQGGSKQLRIHPTQKPVAIPSRAIRNSSKTSDVILDIFLGSGSTLIACEQTKRKCYGMELDEHYCSVIITRWLNYMIKEEKDITLKCNGEIINYKEVLDAK